MVSNEDVLKALRNVIDPELGIDVVALGLVYDIKVRGQEVFVNMTLTSPGCPIAPQIMADAEKNIEKVRGVRRAKVEFVFDPPWTPDKMSPDARFELGI